LDLAYLVHDECPKILIGDIVRLRQVLLNLVGNGVKFTARGEVAVEVKVASLAVRNRNESGETNPADDCLLQFSVRDTGIGIPLEKQGRLFRSFQQVDASTTRHYGGTGLGLAICKRLVELMGGRIWVESDAGRGATFHFTIHVGAATSTTPATWQESVPQLAGRKLLVIEDNETIRTKISRRARQWGMTVETAAGRDAAFRLLAQHAPFDLVLVDYQLPEMDGLVLATQIHQNPPSQNLPLLLLTSERLRADDLRLVNTGVTGMVHKPIRPAQLLDAICRALDIRLESAKRAPLCRVLDTGLAQRLPLRLLLADDNPINQKVGLSVLKKLGYQADLAANGVEVLHALEKNPYDLVFLDVQMPEMDGLEAAREICRRWPAGKRPHLIAMTGAALVGDKEKCLAAGMDDYVSKPVRVGELQAVIEKWGAAKAVPVAAAAPDEALLDARMIAELREVPSDGGAPLLVELVDLFRESAPRNLAQIRASLHDPAKLSFEAHTLKSMSLNLGANHVVALAQKLETLGRTGHLEACEPLLAELEQAYKLTEAELLSLRNAEH
ncbi:MAG: response regulator, partial [Verrucomicrobia bacterium]|nr:response regulator [Verrucomicrobiota bacterium]